MVSPVVLEGSCVIDAVGTGIESSDAHSPFAVCVCLDLVSPRSATHDWRMATSRMLRDRLDHSKSINSSSGWTTLRRCTQSKSCRLPIDVFRETRKNRGYQSSMRQVGPKHGGSSGRDWTEMHNNAATFCSLIHPLQPKKQEDKCRQSV